MARHVNLVLVGHLGYNEDRSPVGSHTSSGGAAYGAARGAAVLAPSAVGVVSVVGTDYDLGPLGDLGVDTTGVQVRTGVSARFLIYQHADGTRSFDADLGVATNVTLDAFPPEYVLAQHVHLCTAPPSQQLAWLRFLNAQSSTRTISADMFEAYAKSEPELSRSVLSACDLVFMNDEELGILCPTGLPPDTAALIKHGPKGASYIKSGVTIHQPTKRVRVVDTTHAGEILAGVFLRLRGAGVSADKALSSAVRAATAKVTEFGVDGEALRTTLDDIGYEAGYGS